MDPMPTEALLDAGRATRHGARDAKAGLAGLAALLLLLLIAACAAVPRETRPPVTIIPGPILTFPFAPERDGVPVLCNAAAAVNPVRGSFEGDPARSSQVAWLRGPDGRQMSVAWPQGFTVRFEPDAVLYDERGVPVARQDDEVQLPQVNLEEAAGTLVDPYIADGHVFQGCYPRAG
jgi:hypothetical protein